MNEAHCIISGPVKRCFLKAFQSTGNARILRSLTPNIFDFQKTTTQQQNMMKTIEAIWVFKIHVCLKTVLRGVYRIKNECKRYLFKQNKHHYYLICFSQILLKHITKKCIYKKWMYSYTYLRKRRTLYLFHLKKWCKFFSRIGQRPLYTDLCLKNGYFKSQKVYLLSICFQFTQIFVRSLELLFPGFVSSA